MLLHSLKRRHVAASCLGQPRFLSSSPHRLRRHLIFEGRSTNDAGSDVVSKTPFYLETGYSIFAKRPARPFPPPFLSTPSHSFSDPLTTHQRSRRGPEVEGKLIRGITNGDDAVLIGSQNFLCVNDGVGAWAQKDRGHAALWSRLIAHYWAVEAEKLYEPDEDVELEKLDIIKCLQTAFEKTKTATTTTTNNGILGTTTASSALLHHRDGKPVLLATQLGDCQVLVIRPEKAELIYKTEEQWHWFDCPRQLGTNSPDTPEGNAKMDTVEVEEGDVVVVASDGLSDNLFENEIIHKVSDCVKMWQNGEYDAQDGVLYVARTLMHAAREIAQDPNAESPYMERAMDEGLAAAGGKLDDISVVMGVCRKRA